MASDMLRVSAIDKSLPLTIFEDEVMFTDSVKCRTRLRVLFDYDVMFNVSDMFFILPITKLFASVRPRLSTTFRAISLTNIIVVNCFQHPSFKANQILEMVPMTTRDD